MKIIWELDDEDGLDPVDPLGSICLMDNEKNKIKDECIFLDSFFESLARGFIEISKNRDYDSEIIDEPYSLRFLRENGSVTVSLKSQCINIKDLSDAKDNLIKAFTEFKRKLEIEDSGLQEIDALFNQLNNLEF